MGIFNYTSSFLHAANQKYFSYLLMKSSLISYQEESTIVMFAHSDDSGGRLTVSDKPMAKRALILYEINLKACNHLLSKKKSVVSRIYFEILSIIYIFKQLLALLPKFLGGLRFLPTDKGPAQDMLQSYSKCIEVMVAGSNFNIAYMVMKFYSMIVWRFYYNREVTQDDYNRPVQYLGMPDAHPLLVLLCGSDAELLRLMKDKSNLKTQMAFVNTMLKTNDNDSGPIKPLSFEIKVRGIGKGFEESLDEFSDILKSWSVRNVNYHNSLFNALSFLSKLNDSGFVGSLVNESTTRRLSRCFYMRSGDSCITRLGNLKLNKVLDSLSLYQKFTTKSEGVLMIFNEVLGTETISQINEEIEKGIVETEKQILILEKTLYSPLKINQYLDNLTLEGRKITVSTRTLKPTVLQLNKTSRVFSTEFDPPTLVSYIKEPELNWALNDTRGLITATEELKEFCLEIGLEMDNIKPDDLLRICRTYGRENTKMIYLYSRVPSELRHIKSYSAFLTFLSVNTFDNKEIEGLTLKLTGRDAVRDYVETNINQEVYLINNIISVINVFINKVDNVFLFNCNIKGITEIGWETGSFRDFLKHLDEFFVEDIHYSLIKPQLKFLMSKAGISERSATVLKGGAFYTFLKNQKVRGGWYGKGEIMIVIENSFYSFSLFNTEIVSIQTNRSGRLPSHHSKFIRDVFNHTNINYNSITKNKKKISVYKKLFFGHDSIGNLTIAPEREITYGIPCIVTENRGGFLDELHLYKMISMFKDSIKLRNEVFETEQLKKIYFLPIKKAELVPLINQIFIKDEFEQKMIEGGLNDFEDFVLTEIMTEYGVNNYIGFNDFLDGFTGSKTYEVFKKCRDENISKIPKDLVRSIIPAPEGSMARILIDYTTATNDKIIEPVKSLDPNIMRLRSEYPEQNTYISSENLIKYHYTIFSKEEVKEISDSYSKLYESEEYESVRESMIKLLTFWGYGSLVNSIEKFTFTRDNRNFLYFNKNITNPDYITHYEGLYPRLIGSFNKILLDWESHFKNADYPFKYLVYKKTKISDIINDYVKDSCLSIYNYAIFEVEYSHATMRYYNLLIAFLKEEEFVSSVQFELNKHYILGSLPINYQNRKNILLLINNLKDCWLKFNSEKFRLSFTEKLQRFPDNVKNYRSLVKLFNVNMPPSDVHYHGFLNNKILSDIKESVEITAGNRIYRVTSKITKLSDEIVPANEVVKFKYPLKSSVFEDENYEELYSELTMEDKDEETILEYWEMLKNPYKQKVTKTMNVKGQKLIRGNVNWVISPYKSCTYKEVDCLRQVGENIVYLTNTFIKDFCDCFPNSGVRVVSYDDGKIMLAHYTFVEDFNSEFIRKYIGGEDFNLQQTVINEMALSQLRDLDGTINHSSAMGFKNIIERSLINTRYEEVNGVTVPIDYDLKTEAEENSEKRISKEEAKHINILEELKRLEKAGLSKNSLKRLNEKYMEKCVKNKIPLEIIMSSLIREGELNMINEMIINNTLDLNADQQRSAFLSPDCFGLAYGMNKVEDPKSIKNSKIRAELESFHKELSSGIGSCTVELSDRFRKTVNSHVRLWKNTVKNTKHKRENKMFLLTVFLSLVNSSRPSQDTKKDYIWQDIINKGTEYIAEEIEETEDDDFLHLMFDFVHSTRLRYLPEGM